MRLNPTGRFPIFASGSRRSSADRPSVVVVVLAFNNVSDTIECAEQIQARLSERSRSVG